MDILGLGLPNDNNFQPITSFVSLALLGKEIVVGNLAWIRPETRDLLSSRIAVLFCKLSTPKVNRCLHMDIIRY